nr:hypothetical protein [Paracoccus sp. J39]
MGVTVGLAVLRHDEAMPGQHPVVMGHGFGMHIGVQPGQPQIGLHLACQVGPGVQQGGHEHVARDPAQGVKMDMHLRVPFQSCPV